MIIGIIQGKEPAVHTQYYFRALSFVNYVDIVSNKPIPGAGKPVRIQSIEDIENNNFDYVFYGWHYINKEKLTPKAKSKIVTFMCGDKVYWTIPSTVLKMSYRCFKVSCLKDKSVYMDHSKRVHPFNREKDNLTNEDIDKIRPLMYISNTVNYPVFPTHNKHLVSFIGSITSSNRINVVKLLMNNLGTKFFGGFCNDTRGVTAWDEDGVNIAGWDVSKCMIPGIPESKFLQLINDSIISICPAGWGHNTHRWVDVLCLGGFALSCDLSHIDYGILGPVENIHYVSYKNDMSDILDKIDYYMHHQEEVAIIRGRAKNHMRQTYLNPKKMAEEYLLKGLV